MLNIANLSKTLGGRLLYQGASFQVYEGEKVGLVGPNGSGKSSLFRMIMREESPDGGQISFPEKKRIAYFSQSVGEMKGRTALQEVLQGDEKILELQEKLKEFEAKLADYDALSEDEVAKLLEKMGEVQTEFENRGGYDLEIRAQEILTGLGISPEDHQKKVEHFSGGWKMRIALAKVLVTNPDLILMDEPTNYLDMETILWLEEWLKQFKGAVLMTTHDYYFMNNIAKKIVAISNGRIATFSGNYDFYLQEKEVRLSQVKAEAARQQKNLQKEEEFIARFKARASHAAQVQSRVKKLEKIERIEVPPEELKIDFDFAKPDRGGDEVIVLENLAKVWTRDDGSTLNVFENLTTTISRLEKVALVGVNGAGKSTLLKVITGQSEPTAGTFRIGPSIKMGYFSQFVLDVLDGESTVFDAIRAVLSEASDGYINNLLAAFLFRGGDTEKKIKYLSGGEKSRLVLAQILSQKNNFLVLDEPTNHLDIASREVLLKALQEFEGTVVFVSHDRHFLDRLATKVYEIDKNQVTIYPGNYQYYLEKKAKK